MSETYPLNLVNSNEELFNSLDIKINTISEAGKVPLLLLYGDLGAGKTTFLKLFLKWKFKNHEQLVSSPSFVKINEYNFDNYKVLHIDAYRIEHEEESLEALDLLTYMDCALWVVEWPQKFMALKNSLKLDSYIYFDSIELCFSSVDSDRFVSFQS